MVRSRELLKGSFIVTVGTFVGGIFSYGFSLTMGRLLGPERFGDIGVASSILMVLGAFGTALLLVAMHFGGSFIAQRRPDLAKDLHDRLILRVAQATAIIVGLILIFILPISDWFSIHNHWAFAIIILSLLFSMPLFIGRGFLQGAKNFSGFSWSNVVELAVKFFVALLLVWAGLSINGAAAAFIVSSFVAYWFTERSLKKLWLSPTAHSGKEVVAGSRELVSYAWPAALSSALNLIAINLDIVLAKIFFPPALAGQYVAISTVAKIIFYITGPISSVMFPLITEQRATGVAHYRTLFLSLGFTAAASVVLLVAYYLFQKPIIGLFYGSQYIELSGLLFSSALIVVSLSFTNLMSVYFLSIKRFGFIYVLLTGIVVALVAVGLYHETIEQMLRSLLIGSSLLLALMVVYYVVIKWEGARAYFKHTHG